MPPVASSTISTERRRYHTPKFQVYAKVVIAGHWSFSFVARAHFIRDQNFDPARNRRREAPEEEVKPGDSPVISDGREEGRTNERSANHLFSPSVECPSIPTFLSHSDAELRMRTREYTAHLSTAGGLGDFSYKTADGVILISAMPVACGSKLRAIVGHPRRLHARYS